MNHRRHAVRLRLQHERLAPETVVRHLRRKKLLILPHQPAQRRRRMALRSAIGRHHVGHPEQRVTRQRRDAQGHALLHRDEIVLVVRRERDVQDVAVPHRQHRAGRRSVGESSRHIGRGVQLQQPERRAKQHRRGLRPSDARQRAPADGHIDLHRLRDREIVRRVRRREDRGKNLPAARRQHRARRRRIDEPARHIHRRVQLHAAQNRPLLHRGGRGPLHIGQRPGHVQPDLLGGAGKVRRVIRREDHLKKLPRARVQHRAEGRIVSQRPRHIRRGVQLRARERRTVDDVRRLRPRHFRRSLQDMERHRLRDAGKIRRVHRREDHGQSLIGTGEQDSARRGTVGQDTGRIRLRVQLQPAERRAVKNWRGRRPRNDRAAHPHPQRPRRERRLRHARARRDRRLVGTNVLAGQRTRVAFKVGHDVIKTVHCVAQRRTRPARTENSIRAVRDQQRVHREHAGVGDAERGAGEQVRGPGEVLRPEPQIHNAPRGLEHDVVRHRGIFRRQGRGLAAHRAREADHEGVVAVHEGVERHQCVADLKIAVERRIQKALHEHQRRARGGAGQVLEIVVQHPVVLAHEAHAAGQRLEVAQEIVALDLAGMAMPQRERAFAFPKGVAPVNVFAGLAGDDFHVAIAPVKEVVLHRGARNVHRVIRGADADALAAVRRRGERRARPEVVARDDVVVRQARRGPFADPHDEGGSDVGFALEVTALDAVAYAVDRDPLGVVGQVRRVVVHDGAVDELRMVRHERSAFAKGDDVAAGAVAVREGESVHNEVTAGQAQAGLAGEVDAPVGLRTQGHGLGRGAVGGEEDVGVGPHAVLHDEGVAGLGGEGGGGDGGGVRDQHFGGVGGGRVHGGTHQQRRRQAAALSHGHQSFF